MFNQMRSVLALQRTMAAVEEKDPVTPHDVIRWATIEGARANGLDHKTGSLTPGKRADIILLRTDLLNVTPLNDPATAVVAAMDTRNVDTVLVDGHVLKRDGKLLHVDWPGVARMAAESRDFVVNKAGFRPPKI
jgi:cytosine/adenosine deaminase-related metal-dependent hydrolase